MDEIRQALLVSDLLAQLAEEAAELSAAAGKLARILRGNNPSPVGFQEARQAVIEEFTDVCLCAEVAEVKMNAMIYIAKLQRWQDRLKGRTGNAE